jgi:MFS family permease
MTSVLSGAARAEWRRGWPAVTSAALGSATGLILYPFLGSLFVQAFLQAFGWSRGEAATASVFGLLAGLTAPLVGRAADRFGTRPVILVSATGFAATCFSMTFQSGALPIYYGLHFCLIAFGLGISSITWSRIVSGAFDASRGLALSLALSSVTLTAAVMPPLLHAVMATWDWRAGWWLLGVLALLGSMAGVGVLPARLSPPGRSKPAPRRSDAPPAAADASFRNAVRTPGFWLLTVGMLLVNIPSGGLMNQMAVLLADRGFPGGTVALVLSGFAVSVFAGRILSGVCLDRYPPPLVAFVALGLPAVGCGLLMGPGGLWVAVAGLVLAGLSQGAESDVGPFMVARYFGLQAFGGVMGSVNAGVVVGSALGAGLFGTIHDRTGSYDLALGIGVVCFLTGAALFGAVGWRRRDARPDPDLNLTSRSPRDA